MPLAAPTITSCNPVAVDKVQLAWDNNDFYDSIAVNRDGTAIAVLGGGDTHYLSEGLGDGITYVYTVTGTINSMPPESAFSDPANATTPLKADSGLDGRAWPPNESSIRWTINTSNATGHKVYRNGILITTVGASVNSYDDSGLTPGTWYAYQVVAVNAVTESAASNVCNIFIGPPPNAPSDPVAVAVSTEQINITWKDNSDDENGFDVEESPDGTTGWTVIGTVGPGIQSYQRAGLAANTLKYYRIYAYNDSGVSDPTAVVNARTFAAISDPTNLVATSFSDEEVELKFQDNSSAEDGHEAYRKEGIGDFELIVTLAPNQDFYRDSGLEKGHTYDYKVRAMQGATPSEYSNVASATTISEPDAPTLLAIGEIKDRSMRLTWIPTTGETGYRIKKSTDGGANYNEIAKVEDGVSYFLVKGLSPAAEYYFTVCAYNIAGDSGWAGPVHDTTMAAYVRTDYESLIRLPALEFVYLVEMNPKMTLSGWAPTGGKLHTYELAIGERGIDIDEVLANNSAFTEKSSVDDVESEASSFYFDYFGRKIYVHVPGGGNPINYMVEGGFKLYFTNMTGAPGPLVFNGHNYLPMLSDIDIPNVRQEISPLHEGNFAIDSGTISVKNMELGGEYYWDKRFSRYTWLNRRVIVMLGTFGFDYSDFDVPFTGNIVKDTVVDEKMSFELEDSRSGIHRDLPINKFWQTDYAGLSNGDNGKPIPMGLGTCLNTVPTCIDPTRRKYKLRDGRIKAVTEVRQNGVKLDAGTDYFVDYQNAIITLSRSLILDNADIIAVDFEGLPNSADELIENGADLFIYECRVWLGMRLDELHLDSIYEAKYLCAYKLATPGYKETTSEEFNRMIERSINGYTFQDGRGRLGLKVLSDVPELGVKYIRNHHVSDFSREEKIDDQFNRVDVYHSENQGTKIWSIASVTNNVAAWKNRTQKPLDPIYTFLTSAADAQARAAEIRDGLGKQPIKFTVPAILFGNLAGDLAYFSRDRFPSDSGSANELLIRLLSIEKKIGERKTRIEAEVVK